MTGRSAMAQRMLDAWRQVRNGRYWVRRGAVNWAAFDFSKNPFAVAVMIDEATFMRPINDATVTFEVFTRIPEQGGDPLLDDEEIEKLVDDAVEVILLGSAFDQGPFRYEPLENSARVVECSDSSLGVQGVVISFDVKF